MRDLANSVKCGMDAHPHGVCAHLGERKTRNMINDEIKLDYDDILIVPQRSPVASRKLVDLTIERSFSHRSAIYQGVPIMAANMDGVGTMEMADALCKYGIFTCLTKFHATEELISFFSADRKRSHYCAVTIGIGDEDWQKFAAVHTSLGNDLAYACLDVANGYTDRFVKCVEKFCALYPDKVLIAGNVVTPEQTLRLLEAGADIVKVGIGGGSVCETRLKTGIGYPQFSAVLECADAAHSQGGSIVADGGCTTPGDVAKALAAGADFVMLGGMLAGHPEGGGLPVDRYFQSCEIGHDGKPIFEKKQYVEFYGMSSKTANEKHFGGLKDYRSSEGRTVLLPLRPSLADTIHDLLGGLRSTCSYVGAEKLSDLKDKARFVRCTHTHNRIFEELSR